MIFLVTALPAEAKPVVEALGLRRDSEATLFTVYRGDNTALVVSGLGAAASAAACAYLYARSGETRGVWINVGLAGSRRPVGEVVLAHSVRDAGSARRWYPMWVTSPPVPLAPVITGARVEESFDEATAVYEMEAAGFIAVAQRTSSSELVHCLKVVSDGPGDRPEQLTAAAVHGLMANTLEPLRRLIDDLKPLIPAATGSRGGQEAEPADFETCVDRWHFTVADRTALRKLLHRRTVLAPQAPLPLDAVPDRARGRRVNQVLRAWLDGLPPRLGPST